MKLIDILIENDIQWPADADGVVQDFDGMVKFYAGEKPRLSNGVWIRKGSLGVSGNFYKQLSSDYATAIVTKQEWKRKVSKSSKATFADVKIGDNVWDSQKGWGVVDEVRHRSDYPIRVDFGHDYDSYTLDGYHSMTDVNPALFWDEFEIKALPKLEVDTKVVVWHNDRSKYHRHFSHFDKDGVLHAFIDGLTSFSGKGGTATWDNWELAE